MRRLGYYEAMDQGLVRDVQRYYPILYHACHVDHVRARSTTLRLSSKDAALLAHLDPVEPMTAGRLAAHFAIGLPALSAAVTRLVRLGYASRERRPEDRRHVGLRLTPAGEKAMAGASVLDAARVSAMLGGLTPADRRRAVSGLAILARAALGLRRVVVRGRRRTS